MTRTTTTHPKRPSGTGSRTAPSLDPTAPVLEEGELLLFFTPRTPSLAALATLEHLGWPYRVCRVQPEELDVDMFRRLNPKGRVPVLWTDDGLLTENTAVLMHLCTLGFRAGALPSPGTRDRDLFYEWLGYLDGSLRPAFEPLLEPQRFVSEQGDFTDVRRRARRALEEHLRYVDGRLEPGPFVLGEDYSVLDSYLFAMVRLSEELFDISSITPRIGLHLEQVRDQPEMQFALAVEKAREIPEPGPGGGYRGEVDLESLVDALEANRADAQPSRPPSSPVGGISPTP